jgi:hypothetical protein
VIHWCECILHIYAAPRVNLMTLLCRISLLCSWNWKQHNFALAPINTRLYFCTDHSITRVHNVSFTNSIFSRTLLFISTNAPQFWIMYSMKLKYLL